MCFDLSSGHFQSWSLPKRFSPPPESWKLTLDRWQRSLPDGKAALVLLIVPLAVWWLWPESSGNVGRTYRAMYDELRELRERPNDKTGMEDFVQRSQAKLDQLIPVLEKRGHRVDYKAMFGAAG